MSTLAYFNVRIILSLNINIILLHNIIYYSIILKKYSINVFNIIAILIKCYKIIIIIAKYKTNIETMFYRAKIILF